VGVVAGLLTLVFVRRPGWGDLIGLLLPPVEGWLGAVGIKLKARDSISCGHRPRETSVSFSLFTTDRAGIEPAR